MPCVYAEGESYGPLAPGTEALIRQHASADSYQRGRECYEQGAVGERHSARRRDAVDVGIVALRLQEHNDRDQPSEAAYQ